MVGIYWVRVTRNEYVYYTRAHRQRNNFSTFRANAPASIFCAAVPTPSLPNAAAIGWTTFTL